MTTKQKQQLEKMKAQDPDIYIHKEKKVRINGRFYSCLILGKAGSIIAVINHQGTCGGNVSALS